MLVLVLVLCRDVFRSVVWCGVVLFGMLWFGVLPRVVMFCGFERWLWCCCEGVGCGWVVRRLFFKPSIFHKGAVGTIARPLKTHGILALTEEDQIFRLGFRGAAFWSLANTGNTMGNRWILIADGGAPLGEVQHQCNTIVCCVVLCYDVVCCNDALRCVVLRVVVRCGVVWCGVV